MTITELPRGKWSIEPGLIAERYLTPPVDGDLNLFAMSNSRSIVQQDVWSMRWTENIISVCPYGWIRTSL